MSNSIVDMAYQIIDMHEKIAGLEMELYRLRGYEEKYHELLSSSMDHSQHMIGSIFKLALTPGVLEACKDNAKIES